MMQNWQLEENQVESLKTEYKRVAQRSMIAHQRAIINMWTFKTIKGS